MSAFTFILLGATGDLAMRKIFPCLFDALAKDLLPPGRIIASSRATLTREAFLERLNQRSKIHIKDAQPSTWENFEKMISYLPLDLARGEDYARLAGEVAEELAGELAGGGNIIIYFSISPDFFSQVCANLARVGLAEPRVKIVLEKPLGKDLASCVEINARVGDFYAEEQIYRIDHYLGKESIQNLLALRAKNPIFASLWDGAHISSVEIVVFETLGVESRGEFYDGTGALRDMVQNHLLQILSLIAMEIPAKLDAKGIRAEKLKLLKSLRPFSDDEDISRRVIRAQYEAGGEFKGYLSEDNVRANSRTETFVALLAEVANERWRGVSFFIRTGKRMAEAYGEIVINFKNTALPGEHNRLLIRLQPDNEIALKIKTKKLGQPQAYEEKTLDLHLDAARAMQPYERLILDLIASNQANFNHKEELEAAWHWIDPVLKNWAEEKSPLHSYPAGSYGPAAALALK